jgi:hypothetical protein
MRHSSPAHNSARARDGRLRGTLRHSRRRIASLIDGRSAREKNGNGGAACAATLFFF